MTTTSISERVQAGTGSVPDCAHHWRHGHKIQQRISGSGGTPPPGSNTQAAQGGSRVKRKVSKRPK